MPDNSEPTVVLPEFVLGEEVSSALQAGLPGHLSEEQSCETIRFDWSAVRFFDDYTLLKLILIQRRMRCKGIRVQNRGFQLAGFNDAQQHVVRQLWATGLPELFASGHLLSPPHLKPALLDDHELMESNPFGGVGATAAAPAIIPMLCCHEREHFLPGSREEKRVERFLLGCVRQVEGRLSSWDLIESREFRHLVLQQLRHNVREHARRDRPDAVGLALTRIWTEQSLEVEWGITGTRRNHLLDLCGDEPVLSMLRGLRPGSALLQVSLVDNGVGIPQYLEAVHKELFVETGQMAFSFAGERPTYKTTPDREFNDHFSEPALWPDPTARLISFATAALGTSKPDRAPETKGLTHVRTALAIGRRGSLLIESGGAAVSGFEEDHRFGKPVPLKLSWVGEGGTGVSLCAPMVPVVGVSDSGPPAPRRPGTVGLRAHAGTDEKRVLKVWDFLDATAFDEEESGPESSQRRLCVEQILGRLLLDEPTDRDELRRQGLILIDWGEIPESKRLLHYLLTSLAKAFASQPADRIRPFVFANLPLALCGLLGRGFEAFSEGPNPTPVCAFTGSRAGVFWLGIDGENSLNDRYAGCMRQHRRRKITDESENRTEAFHRKCLDSLLGHVRKTGVRTHTVLKAAGIPEELHRTLNSSVTMSRLEHLASRCPLFREEWRGSRGKEKPSLEFRPVFSLEEIIGEVRGLLLEKFGAVVKSSPVCFKPESDEEGVRLPHSSRVVPRYYRCDALVDSPIATELAQELVHLALAIAESTPTASIDWVVSCTSPLHWFVHQVVDGLAEAGITTSHFVFPSYESIPSSLNQVQMSKGEQVLVLADVISSGNTARRIGDLLTKQFAVEMAGLVSLIDTRGKDELAEDSSLDTLYRHHAVSLLSIPPQEERQDKPLKPAYYVHPETAVPTRSADRPADDFFSDNFAGTGPLAEGHAYFHSPDASLDVLVARDALRLGHFQHGDHHSEVFVDVEAALSWTPYRAAVVTALFRYITERGIGLVVYPSHSGVYLIVDELRQRFDPNTAEVTFAMACRTFKGNRGANYSLTRFSPDPKPSWGAHRASGILLMDDAICSGGTVGSILAELARIDRGYYMRSQSVRGSGDGGGFPVHIVVFLNRLPRVSGDFWSGLRRLTGGQVSFSSLLSLPLPATSPDACPECRLERRLERALDSREWSSYAKEFLSRWQLSLEVIKSHERRYAPQRTVSEPFSSSEVRRIAAYLCAIDRQAYAVVKDELPGESSAVQVYVRSRAAFLCGALGDGLAELVRELKDILFLVKPGPNASVSRTGCTHLLRALTLRYLRTRPSPQEAQKVVARVLAELSSPGTDRLTLSGVASVIDACVSWPRKEAEPVSLRASLHEYIRRIRRSLSAPGEALWFFDWLDVYLGTDGQDLPSAGKAVLRLARYAQEGKPNHIYERHELDRLRHDFSRPAAECPANWHMDLVTRASASTRHFSDLLSGARAVRSRVPDPVMLASIEAFTVDVLDQLGKACRGFLSQTAKRSEKSDWLKQVHAAYARLYDRWFPSNGRPASAQIIDWFLPCLREKVLAAHSSFGLPDGDVRMPDMDATSLDAHANLRVIVDPDVLTVTLHQLLDNVVRRIGEAGHAQVTFNLAKVDKRASPNADRMVCLVVSNKGTPRPQTPHVALRGLRQVGLLLDDFGGSLKVRLPPDEPWSFQVEIQLRRWTENEQ